MLSSTLFQYRSLIGSLGIQWHQKLRIKEIWTAVEKKLSYAFIWSETAFQLPNPSDPLLNLVGGGMIPDINVAANMFNSRYTTTDSYLQYHDNFFQVTHIRALMSDVNSDDRLH